MSEKKYEALMIDLETLGLEPTSVIVSAGVIAFDRELGVALRGLRLVLDRPEQVAAGRTTTPSTLKWWGEQSPEAQRVLTDPQLPHFLAVPQLARYCEEYLKGGASVWGNGFDFDGSMLVHYLAGFGHPVPWSYRGHSCYRTLRRLVPPERLRQAEAGVSGAFPSLVRHDALGDATFQAHVAVVLWRWCSADPGEAS